MSCPLCLGLRLCVRHHPPLVTFLLCLATLAITFLCFGLYLRSYPVTDDAFTKDFDTVLQTLSARPICPQHNVTGLPTSRPSALDHEDHDDVSVLADVTLTPSGNHSGLRIRTTAGQLGIRDPGTDCPLLVTVAPSWGSTQCNDSDSVCSGKVCVIVTGPRSVLPQTWSSFQCSAVTPGSYQLPPELYVGEKDTGVTSECYSLKYRGDPALKAKMSAEDCAVVSGRLLSAVLVCFLITLLLIVVGACWSYPLKDKRTPGPGLL
ncbi:LOW QUALITY PROTEIN: insulin-like growth factor-binding protein 3 receptor [Phyllobates terribilis]|uniref:LOW QUALITY PROTEIN: insulin-like growth factor-binding protein 3 receptor n=1 Tax=Phyllobates terribilis TaxID=111132 RepID=UPI003CCB377B